jgi:hypothetical protein
LRQRGGQGGVILHTQITAQPKQAFWVSFLHASR